MCRIDERNNVIEYIHVGHANKYYSSMIMTTLFQELDCIGIFIKYIILIFNYSYH